MIWFAVTVFVVLHSIDGREVYVSLDEITSLHCKMPGVENKMFVEGVNTLVNLSDGKYASVRETCSEVRDLIQEVQK